MGFPVLKAGESQAKWDEWVTAVSRKMKRQSSYRDRQSSWLIIRDHRRQARHLSITISIPGTVRFPGGGAYTQ